MDFLDILIGSSTGLKGLFYFFGSDLHPDQNIEEFLEDDFPKEYLTDGSRKFLFIELERLKEEYRKNMYEAKPLLDAEGKPLPQYVIQNIIEAHKNRIKKVRLMLHTDLQIAFNLHKPSGVTYVVARAYWIDKNGKKYRKFSKFLGPASKVVVKNAIPNSTMEDVRKDILRQMWDQYKTEYEK